MDKLTQQTNDETNRTHYVNVAQNKRGHENKQCKTWFKTNFVPMDKQENTQHNKTQAIKQITPYYNHYFTTYSSIRNGHENKYYRVSLVDSYVVSMDTLKNTVYSFYQSCTT